MNKKDTTAVKNNNSTYLVTLCMVAYVFSFIDRQIVILLIEPIRADLQISDTQFSLLHGLSFAIFYAVMGIPIARLADTKSRPLIISIGVATWSLATSLCGLANNFLQLFLARMGVGVGEAALSPAAYSMISDSVPKAKLGRALAVYSMGSFLGTGLAFIIGGVSIEWISTTIGIVDIPILGLVKPWQMTFFLVGIPGLIIALLFYVTISEPKRKGVVNGSAGFTVSEVSNYIRTNSKTFIAHYLGFSLLSLVLFAFLSWAAAFLMRNFEMNTQEVGLYLGIIILIANVLGVFCSGWLVDLFTKHGFKDAAFRTGIVGAAGVLIPALIFAHQDSLWSTLVILSVALFFASFPMATSATALQTMAPNRMRAQVTAIFFLFMNLFGIVGGASLPALISDYIYKDESAIGVALSIVVCVASVSAILVLFWGLKYYRETIDRLTLNNK